MLYCFTVQNVRNETSSVILALKMLLAAVLFSVSVLAYANSDCLLAFHNAVHRAIDNYDSGIAECEGRWFPSLCNLEVQARFNVEIQMAVDTFNCCYYGC